MIVREKRADIVGSARERKKSGRAGIEMDVATDCLLRRMNGRSDSGR